MDTTLGQWIAGTKDGRPVLFNVNTGATRAVPQQHHNSRAKRARREGPSPGGWIVGQKDGRVCYFNPATKQSSFQPPGVSGQGPSPQIPSPEPIPFALPVPVPAPTGCPSGDTKKPFALLDFDTDAMMVDPMADLDLGGGVDLAGLGSFGAEWLDTAPQLPPQLPAATTALGKREQKKMRNRASANRSRQKKRDQMAQCKSRIGDLEGTVAQLQQALAASEAEKKVMREQLNFLQTLVTQKVHGKGQPR